jgi:hypothetical protein
MRSLLLVLMVGAGSLIGCGGVESESPEMRFTSGDNGLLMSVNGSQPQPVEQLLLSSEAGTVHSFDDPIQVGDGYCCWDCYEVRTYVYVCNPDSCGTC